MRNYTFFTGLVWCWKPELFRGRVSGDAVREAVRARWCTLGSGPFRRVGPSAEPVSIGRGCPRSPGALPQLDVNQGGSGGLHPVQVLLAPVAAWGGTPGLAACVATRSTPGWPGGQLGLSTGGRRPHTRGPEHVTVTPGAGGRQGPGSPSLRQHPSGGLSLCPALPSDSQQAFSGSGEGTDFCKILLNKMAWTRPRSRWLICFVGAAVRSAAVQAPMPDAAPAPPHPSAGASVLPQASSIHPGVRPKQ